MASLRTSTASCFGCIASRPLLASARPAATLSNVGISINTNQYRGKKTKQDGQGVVVRLLKDVTQFGRRDTILRVDRGRMRNFWYPRGMAEYMTAARIAELGPAAKIADLISFRDSSFVAEEDGVAGEEKIDTEAPSVSAAAHIETIIPASIIFYRKPISSETSAIFGSVSADDVANMVREVLLASQDEEAMLVRVEPRDVHFIVPESQKTEEGDSASTVDRIKALGRWEVDIVVRGSQGSNEPARRTRAAQEAAAAASSSVTVRKIVEVIAAHE
ncbi:hypothetical protein Sste5346_003718 [Sporothrix stenoceras]|uniref:Ribosomal protein L9 domain-containing protein n=1 Tax=Sporothrix stenoceras TaxID=5173 RepID=A0ABR3ZCS6_9PEZI